MACLLAAVGLGLWLALPQQPADASSRKVTVSPSPITRGEPFVVRGTGWASGRTVAINICEDANNDNCARLGRRKVVRGKFALRWKGVTSDFTSLRVMACYQPTCTGKMVRRVRVVG